MLTKLGEYKFYVESYVCDFKGKATLPVLGNFLLKAATIHAHQRGFGYEAISKDGVAWVLSRLSIEIYEYPNHDEELLVETWIEDVTRYFTQRCFRLVSLAGETLAYARTIWAAIGVETRRPIDIMAWRPDIADYIADGIACPVGKPSKIPEAGGEPIIGYTVRYSDIDINKHMNSIKYIEHVINVFDLDFFKDNTIRKFEVVYLAEGGFGDKLKLFQSNVSETDCIIDTKKGNESVCRSRITFA